MKTTKRWFSFLFSGILRFIRAFAAFCQANPRDSLGVAFFIGLACGCWMMWPPLGLVVPSTLGLSMLTWSHVRGTEDEPKPLEE